ncbi:NAD(P)/FAD-dependent oxidoreductase [Aurantibacillus circumpalustris]|uniref:NAD(P)/FAD-dependent oxidoreductase n=1 Tax=Aurantibacillus circumpalustris TaxID=3036359 RepID=UPI00295C2F75|nr:FAD-dependent oxidoreductase [Aurantibacillus circumpalustris]
MIDFIIVGRGLAAATLAHTFHKHSISFKIVGSDTMSSCSRVAAGIWNPVVFKRLTKSWLADDLIQELNTFYSECEFLLRKKIITQRSIIKPFTEDQEKTLWKKRAKGELESFLDEHIKLEATEELESYKIVNGYGIVNKCGNLNVADFIDATCEYFKELIINEKFDHSELQLTSEKLTYKEAVAKNIIFCEGYMVKENPLFNWIPLKPAKGEILTIKVPKLKSKNSIFNRNGFIMDVEEGLYRVGATYEWDDLTETPTEKGFQELQEKIKSMLDCDYTLLKHEAGIRPSSKDRRPIIGAHPKLKNAYVFNGLGTKGVMLAPYFAKNFVNSFLNKEPLHKEVDVKRFYTDYDNKG